MTCATWQTLRRKRTRHLIELGGLVVKSGIVDLTGDDRAIILGALLWMADKLKSEEREKALRALGRKGEAGVRSGTRDRCAHDAAGNAAGSGVTDGGSHVPHSAGSKTLVFGTPRAVWQGASRLEGATQALEERFDLAHEFLPRVFVDVLHAKRIL